MGDLTGQTVASTYSQLLNVASLDATYRNVTDGDGTASGLTLSTGGVRASLLNATGAVTFDSTLEVTSAITATGGVVGSVTGDVTGNVTGDLTGDATGDLTGNIKTTDASATVTTILNANVGSDDAATFTGNVTGDLTGNVTGDITGNVTATSVIADGVTASTQASGDNSTKVATTAYVDSLTTVPTGALTQYAGGSAPNGWLVCDGSTVSRSTYSDLHALLKDVGGTDNYAYGNGDGSTTFTLPDLRGRIPVGVGQQTSGKWDSAEEDYSGSGTNFVLAATGGTEDHKLLTAELPSHSHAVEANSQNYVDGGTARALGSNNGSDGTYNSSSVGSDSPHNNLPPYLALNYIIKT